MGVESEEQREAVCFRLGSALSPELGVGGTAEGNAWPWPPSPSLKKKDSTVDINQHNSDSALRGTLGGTSFAPNPQGHAVTLKYPLYL